MNLPNKLSVLRVFCIPVIVVLLYLGDNTCRLAAAGVFILGSLTDLLDGKIARKYNLVRAGLMEAWVLVLILCRELAVDGLRMVAVGQGKVIAAGPWGKWKTTFQMITVIVILLTDQPCFGTWYTAVLTGISAALTVWSAVDYFVKNRSVFSVK